MNETAAEKSAATTEEQQPNDSSVSVGDSVRIDGVGVGEVQEFDDTQGIERAVVLASETVLIFPRSLVSGGAIETIERPEDCGCPVGDLPCWPCYRRGFEEPVCNGAGE
jgi:hypothetical protein